MKRVAPHEVPFGRLEGVLESLGSGSALDTSDHCLLIFDQSGNSRSGYRDLPIGLVGEMLYIGSPFPFPLNLVPSYEALVAIHQPSSIKRAFDLLAPQGRISVLYAAAQFRAALLGRLAKASRSLNPRARVAGSDYGDLLESYGEDCFALESYFDYDPPLVGYRYGRALPQDLRRLLDTLTV